LIASLIPKEADAMFDDELDAALATLEQLVAAQGEVGPLEPNAS
jgi:hypothetical protein